MNDLDADNAATNLHRRRVSRDGRRCGREGKPLFEPNFLPPRLKGDVDHIGETLV